MVMYRDKMKGVQMHAVYKKLGEWVTSRFFFYPKIGHPRTKKMTVEP